MDSVDLRLGVSLNTLTEIHCSFTWLYRKKRTIVVVVWICLSR